MPDKNTKIIEIPGFKAKEFLLGSNTGSLAEITLTARYPEAGFVANTKTEMTAYVLKGSVVLCRDGENVSLEEGSVALIEIGKEYFWQPEPEVTILIFSTPPWSPEQQIHEIE